MLGRDRINSQREARALARRAKPLDAIREGKPFDHLASDRTIKRDFAALGIRRRDLSMSLTLQKDARQLIEKSDRKANRKRARA